MSKSYLHLFAATLLFFTFFGCGTQPLVLTEGNLNFLKGQKSINVEYQYDNLMVGEMTEEAYLKRKVGEKNSDEPGTGDKWVKRWFDDREEIFQPKFEKSLNEKLETKAIFGSGLQDTEYTLVLKTTFIEPGWNIFISNQPANIQGIILFVETDNPQNVIAVLPIDNCEEKSGSYAVASRISYAYACAGIRLAVTIINYL